MDENYYELIINNEQFLNDCWDTLGVTDKYSVLEKSGFNMVEEFKKFEKEYREGNDYE